LRDAQIVWETREQRELPGFFLGQVFQIIHVFQSAALFLILFQVLKIDEVHGHIINYFNNSVNKTFLKVTSRNSG